MSRSTTWDKRGLVFATDGDQPWMAHHAAVPTPDLVDDERVRIYFSPRDETEKSRITYLEAAADDPTQVLYVHQSPVLDLGRLGTFDDSGVMPSCIVDHEDAKYLYYTGWNQGVTVPYRNAIGLAVSHDGGLTFERAYEGAIVDRSRDEPFFTATPFVLKEDDRWRMWYASSTGWVVEHGHPEPVYVIKYAESDDGLVWRRENVTCIEPHHPEEANARPWVVKDDRYRMWFCFRGSRGYRSDAGQSYRIGYAESDDGISWERMDTEAGIDISSGGGIDDLMVTYPSIYQHAGRRHLIYNGNGFGRTGMSHAVAV